MVTRRAVVTCVLAVCVMAFGQGSALALGKNPPSAGGGGSSQGSGSSGSTGAPVHATKRSCSLYATSSSFGLSCLGSGTGNAPTVEQILGKGKPPPTCWDERISDADLQSQYDETPNPALPSYLHSCITGLDLKSSLYSQPKLQLSQVVIAIPVNAKPCKPPFTDAMLGTCVMTLTGNQPQIVHAIVSEGDQIPGLVIATYPSSRIRTGVATAFVDRADGGKTRTPDYTVGGVTMYASMDSFAIYPYGPDGGVKKDCDGTADVSSTDTPATKPNSCWWTYPKSSNDEPGHVYPFRAAATWTVYVDGHQFATFTKYSDLDLPVLDVQTLVVN